MSLCEVRIPTYKRPLLLKRAISSLISQTDHNWRGIILDDSPKQEGKSVVSDYNDSRLIYMPNEANLGRTKNIDRAFLSTSYVGGDYACVLEDDNYLFPNFLAENIKSLKLNQVNILVRNQEVRIEKQGESLKTNKTTRGRLFDKRAYSPFEVQASLFFCEGISNGGLFWKTNEITSNLQVGSQVEDSWHQEHFRTLQITDVIYFEPTPLSAFTLFSNRPPDKLKNFHERMIYNRSIQSIFMYLIKKYGISVIQEAKKLALDKQDKHLESRLERRLVDALYISYDFKVLNLFTVASILTKSSLRYMLYEEPFKNYYHQLIN